MEAQANQSTLKNYLTFFAGQQVSLLGSSIAQFVIIWWITLTTGSTLYLSIAALLGLAPMIVLAPITGVLADRWSRKVLIGVADMLQALAAMVLIFLFWSGTVSLVLVFALLTLRGIFQAFHAPTVSAIIPSMVPEDKLSRINGLSYLLNGIMTLIGPVIAALLLGLWQIYHILWIDVATFLVALFPLLLIKIPAVRKERGKSSFRKEFVEGFTFIKNARGLLPLLMLATALNFLLTPMSTLLPYYVKFNHFGDATQLAFVMVFFQAGILVGGLVMSMTKGFENKMVAVAFSIYVIFLGYALVALTPTGQFWFMAVGALIMALCIPVANVSTQTIIQTIVPLKMLGRVNSVTMALASAAQPWGMIISGTVAELTGTANLFLGCALLGILAMTLSWFLTDVRFVSNLKSQTTSTPAIVKSSQL
jgi:DHA3 family macrolide efflux protein-like MFS transporter